MAHIPRIYWPDQIECGNQIEITDERAHHLLRVLKRREGDPVTLFQAPDREYACVIESTSKNCLSLMVSELQVRTVESSLQTQLVQGISRAEKMDFSIQKAVELGVSSIQPVLTQRSGVQLDEKRMNKKQAHWQAVALSAAEQSGRTQVPAVLPCLKLADFLQAADLSGVVLDPLGDALTGYQAESNTTTQVLIGPEGGLTDEEVTLAARAGLYRLKLGPRILRTETAGLVALTALQLQFGDLNFQ